MTSLASRPLVASRVSGRQGLLRTPSLRQRCGLRCLRVNSMEGTDSKGGRKPSCSELAAMVLPGNPRFSATEVMEKKGG
ncbi:hypothetical protein NDU88_001104 [Pleurodeles waltl]|uniref:Uncharacterized protein n=1 Tax=Pleurodeles waltl TaxID=8319 RepID=A0AAV7V792_PLEWA|nr:hypothetical protein NDU88_001104 [Pleurodeles waltl]